MSKTVLNLKDKRCIKTRESITKALFSFYAEHSRFEKLPVIMLCRLADVSTPTFYRHFNGIREAIEVAHQEVFICLTGSITPDYSLSINLMRLFHFASDHQIYYRANLHQMCAKPFEDVKVLMEPNISVYIQNIRSTNNNDRSEAVNHWICYEIENHIIAQLKWWIEEDKLSLTKIDKRIHEILSHAKYCISEADRKVRMGEEF